MASVAHSICCSKSRGARAQSFSGWELRWNRRLSPVQVFPSGDLHGNTWQE